MIRKTKAKYFDTKLSNLHQWGYHIYSSSLLSSIYDANNSFFVFDYNSHYSQHIFGGYRLLLL